MLNISLYNSITQLLEEYNYTYTDHALEKIINKWAEVKAPLLNAFKLHPNYIPEQFCIAFDTDYERVVNVHASMHFSSFLIDCMDDYKKDTPAVIQSRKEMPSQWLPQRLYDFLVNLDGYAARTISDETCTLLNEIIPEIHPHAGEKTSRVINRICAYLGYNKHPDYNRNFAKYADSLSPMVIKRHTILSLNPLDYLTMSFGNSWASCHTIDKNNKRNMPNSYSGAYSSGTISYMLDPSSIVFYTVDASYNGNEYWTQPKINRQMFHYGEHKLVQGRLYPQDNDDNASEYTTYRQIVQQVIAQCFDIPNLWTVSKGTDNASKYIYSVGTHYKDYTRYNNCTLSRNKEHPNENYITVGANPICIECGYTHSEEECINCCTSICHRCADCGCDLEDEDDIIWIDGSSYCRDCVSYCQWCDEYHRDEEYYIKDKEIWVCESCYNEDFDCCDECSEDYTRDNMTEVTNQYGNEVYVCNDCLERYYEECIECGEYHWREDMTVNADGDYVCSKCLKSKYAQCDDCEEYHLKEEMRNIGEDLYICESCYKARAV
jgi:hypothetical protein